MPRKRETPGVAIYYKTLQQIFQSQSEILSAVLPHLGERGRNDEERFRDFLTRVIPKRFSVGTGFLVCSDQDIPPSSQTDVVLYDEICNAPIHRELSAFIYPIEIVYGTVEVKGLLQKKDLKKIMEDIQKIRQLARHRWYVRYRGEPKNPDKPNQRVLKTVEFQANTPPPRAFVFAYDKKGWRTIDALVKSLEEAAKERESHIHGLAVLRKDWYVTQEAYPEGDAKFHPYQGDALLRFVHDLLPSVASIPMHQMSTDRYLRNTR